MSGFALTSEAIKSIMDLGMKYVTFTLTFSADESGVVPAYVVMATEKDTAYAYFLNPAASSGQDVNKFHYLASGTEVILDLEALYNVSVGASLMPGVCFIFTADNTLTTTNSAYLTFSNIEFSDVCPEIPVVHEHSWTDATCVAPKTCTTCGETEGTVADHAYGELIAKVEATEENAGMEAHYICATCGKYFDADKNETTEDALKIEYVAPEVHQHSWSNATCVAPKTCTTCGETEGEALGHSWTDATCVAPKTCTTCSETEGTVADHAYGELIAKVEATAEADGMEAHYICATCGKYFDADKNETTEDALKIEYVEIIECDYQFTYTGRYFNSETAMIVTGQTPNALMEVTMMVKTSLDGTATTNPYIGAYASTTTSDSNFYGGGTLDISATGWREITLQLQANENGDIYLGLGRYAEGEAITVYIKDVNFRVVTTEEKAFNVLASAGSYANQYHGKFGGVTATADTVSVYAKNGGHSGMSGFALTAEAIKSILDLGMRYVTVTLTFSADESGIVPAYVVMATEKDTSYAYFLNPSASSGKDANNFHYLANGAEIVLDLEALYNVSVGATLMPGVCFIFTADNTLTTTNSAYLTFSNIEFSDVCPVGPDQSIAFNVLAAASSYADQYNGDFGGVTATADTVSVYAVNGGYSGKSGFSLTDAAIKAIVDAGFRYVTFTLTFSADASGVMPAYVAMVTENDMSYAYFLNPSAAAGKDINNFYCFTSGATVVLDLETLYNVAAGAKYIPGLGFIFTADLNYTTTNSAYLTFSNIEFSDVAPVGPDQSIAFNVLASASSYADQYHGDFGGVTATADSITVCGESGGYSGMSGFALTDTAIKAMVDAGFKYVTLTITLSAGDAGVVPAYVVMATEKDTSYAYFLNPSASSGQDVNNFHYLASGATVVLDLETLYNVSNGANLMPGLCFIFTADNTLSKTATANLTFSNIQFSTTNPVA